MKENVIYVSLRLYMNQPDHVRIHQVLQNLNPMKCRSKNQFIINALKAYIDDPEGNSKALGGNAEDMPVMQKDIKELENKISRQAVAAARDETMRLIGGMFSGFLGRRDETGEEKEGI